MMPRPHGEPRRCRALAGPLGFAAVALVVAVGACDGYNTFQPVTEPPTVISLTAPAQAGLGWELPVSVRAVSIIAIDSIVLSIAGGEVEDAVTLEGESGETDMTREVVFELPEVVGALSLTVTAVAFDEQGNESAPRSVQVGLVDGVPPTVNATLSASAVGQADTLRVTVAGADNVGLAQLGMRVRDSGGALVANRLATVSGASAQATLEWAVPDTQAPGSYQVEAFADDLSSNRTVATVGTVEVEFRDLEAPAVGIETPITGEAFEQGDSIFVRVRIQDEGGFRAVGIEGLSFRGDPDLGTDVTVERFQPWTIELQAPASDTTLTRYLRPTSGEAPTEDVFVIVTATDLAGNVGADSVRVRVGSEPEGDGGARR